MYWRGPVCFQRKVWPVGNVSGSESSDWVRLTGAQFVGLKIIFWCFLEEWRGCGGVGRGGIGDDLLVVGEAGGGVGLARFIVGVGKELPFGDGNFAASYSFPPCVEPRECYLLS